jgi:hypothetical protein
MKPIKLILLPILALTSFAPDPGIKHSGTTNAEIKTASIQEVFSYLRCHRQAKNIVVNWGATSIAGIHHFVVMHSDDNDFFSPIAEIFPDGSSLKYTFKDESVFAGYHYYYIQAVMNAGPPANSIVDVVRIVSHG